MLKALVASLALTVVSFSASAQLRDPLMEVYRQAAEQPNAYDPPPGYLDRITRAAKETSQQMQVDAAERVAALTSNHAKATTDPFIYSEPGCNFSVAFPGKPRISEHFTPTYGAYKQAFYATGNEENGYFARAECMILKVVPPVDAVQQFAVQHIRDNGLRNADISHEASAVGTYIGVRGYKDIRGIPVTYEMHIYLGDGSVLSIYTGGPSSSYPQPGASDFLASVRRNSR